MLSYKKILRKILTLSLHLIFPVSCPVCSRPAVIICDDCLKKLFSKQNIIIREFEAMDFRIFSASHYYSDMKNVILEMKYAGCKALCNPLGLETAKLFEPPEVDFLIPVPLHLDSKRTFNQSYEIAKSMGRFWGIKVFDIAKWTTEVPHHAGMNARERISMSNDVFKITKNILGFKVALVDDVCTTGTTLLRLAQVCRDAGAIVTSAYSLASV